MDYTIESFFSIIGHYTGTLCAKMRMIISAVENIIDTWLFGYRAKETSHCRNCLETILNECAKLQKMFLLCQINLP